MWTDVFNSVMRLTGRVVKSILSKWLPLLTILFLHHQIYERKRNIKIIKKAEDLKPFSFMEILEGTPTFKIK